MSISNFKIYDIVMYRREVMVIKLKMPCEILLIDSRGYLQSYIENIESPPFLLGNISPKLLTLLGY